MSVEDLHTFNCEMDFDDETRENLNNFILSAQSVLNSRRVHDWGRKFVAKADLRNIHDELHGALTTLFEDKAPGLCTRLEVIFHEGIWGCVIGIQSYLKLVIAPVVPWVIKLESSAHPRINVKVIGQCSVVRQPYLMYFDNLPRDAQMYVDASKLQGLLTRPSGKIDAVQRVILSALSGLKTHEMSKGEKRYYPNISGVITTIY